MKKLFGLLLIMGLVLSGCGGSDDKKDSSADGDTLTVLTNAGYPPYEMTDENGDLYGFDIDVMTEAAKLAGVEIKWKNVDFDAIPEMVRQGKGDLAIAGITPDATRAKKVDFSELYYTSEDMKNVVLVKEASPIKTEDDIKGKLIGIQIGTVQQLIMENMEDSYSLSFKKLKSYASLVQELNKGVIDAMVVEKAVADGLMEGNEGLRYFYMESGDELTGNAMIFAKGSPLKEKFNKAIEEMKSNGTLDELVAKWFK
ncbi:hypothetical protein A4S06_01570 [Erysipelotrichaceae bacterium MTC7]|nr:hypothetical protein A4S06_01570 [Erysipelotrichaceae bacterium MTC7]